VGLPRQTPYGFSLAVRLPRYRLAWGSETVTMDALSTGIAEASADLVDLGRTSADLTRSFRAGVSSS